jgi:hypothetical protein
MIIKELANFIATEVYRIDVFSTFYLRYSAAPVAFYPSPPQLNPSMTNFCPSKGRMSYKGFSLQLRNKINVINKK